MPLETETGFKLCSYLVYIIKSILYGKLRRAVQEYVYRKPHVHVFVWSGLIRRQVFSNAAHLSALGCQFDRVLCNPGGLISRTTIGRFSIVTLVENKPFSFPAAYQPMANSEKTPGFLALILPNTWTIYLTLNYFDFGISFGQDLPKLQSSEATAMLQFYVNRALYIQRRQLLNACNLGINSNLVTICLKFRS